MNAEPFKTDPDIIIVTPDIVGPITNGGIGTACFHYARSLVGSGLTVRVLLTHSLPQPDYAKWSSWYRDNYGIDFVCMNDTPLPDRFTHGVNWFSECSHRLMRYLMGQRTKVIFFQDWHGNAYWTARAKKMGVAFADATIGIITHSPNEWQREGMQQFPWSPLDDLNQEWVEREAIASADLLISPSRHMVAWLRDHEYELPDRVEYAPYTFEDPPLNSDLVVPDTDHLIFFGRLETRKGLHLFGDALRLLKTRGARLPKNISLLGKMASVDGIPTDVCLGRLRQDLPDITFRVHTNFSYSEALAYINEARGIVVMPSILDNFPLTVMECIEHKIPFVSTTAGGIPEMGDPRILAEPNHIALADKLGAVRDIAWADLHHKYSREEARTGWTGLVRGLIKEQKIPARSARPKSVERPPISICIPYYRHDACIARTVRELLAMRYPALQLVLVNDGTPQEERPVLESIRDQLSGGYHKFIDQENAGPGAARNRAVAEAMHDHILFFDADNVPFRTLAGSLMDAMQLADADSVCAPFTAFPADAAHPSGDNFLFDYLPLGGYPPSGLLTNVFGDTCSLVKRDVFEEAGGFNETIGCWEDWEFFMRVCSLGRKHFVYPFPLFYYSFNEAGRHMNQSDYLARTSLLNILDDLPPAQVVQVAKVFALSELRRSGHI